MKRSTAVGLAASLGALGTAAALVPWYVPYVTPSVAFAALVGVPWFAIHQLRPLHSDTPAERLTVSLVLAVGVLLAAGLAANTVLPYLGVDRPLDAVPLITTLDVVFAALLAGAARRMPDQLARRTVSGVRSLAVLVGSPLLVVLSAMGATRLNNGAGGGLASVALIAVALLAVVVFVRRVDLGEGTVVLAIYSMSLALLLSTSLRGWHTTGHDVQHEMGVFLATARNGRWGAGIRDAYNACLSITLLPTTVLRWTRVEPAYAFKVFGQLLYAACPVLVYLLARRLAGRTVALLAAIYFVGFVGFVQDMPMLNRQEIAFLFFAAALLCLFVAESSRRRREVLFVILGTGMVVSHYSTTYFALAALSTAWLVLHFQRWLTRGRAADGAATIPAFTAIPEPARLLRLVPLLAVALIGLVWFGPITHGGSEAPGRLRDALDAVRGEREALKDPSAGYALFESGTTTSPEQNLRAVSTKLRKARERADPGTYYDVGLPTPRNTPPIDRQRLPLSSIGRRLDDIGVPVADVNDAMRGGLAVLLQLLLAIGVVAIVASRRWADRIHPLALALTLGVTAPILLQVLVPGISLDYGIGRSFMQALVVIAPVQVIGSLVVARWLRRVRLQSLLPPAIAIAYLSSGTGLVPQTLGGYEPTLNLNNSGQYYDRFYTNDSDVAVLRWMAALAEPGQTDIQLDPSMLNRSFAVKQLIADPELVAAAIRRGSYVVLGTGNVRRDQLEISEPDYELWYSYRYDEGWLARVKDRIYDSGTGRVYR